MSGRTILDVPSLGDVSFPITPTSIDGMAIGASVPAAGTFTTISASTFIAPTVIATTNVTVGNLAVTGTAAIAGTLNLAAGPLNVTGSVAISGSVTVSGPVTVAGNLTVGGYEANSINPTVIAGISTSTFSAAVALTAMINIIVSASGTSACPVALPSVAVVGVGAQVIVMNRGTHTVGVWPQPLDTFDGGSAGTAYALATSGGGIWIAASTTGWVTAVLGTIA
jgi:hypothetical protein